MNRKLTLSIALASYNGERYIREQLESIADQTRLPDELVISDDSSIDATPAIIDDFARHAPFQVQFLRNSERLGSTRNFETAIRACSGDIIFLCDQDDIWYPNKVALIAEKFNDSPATGAVFSDGDVVDESLRPLGKLWKIFKFNPKEQAQMASGNALRVLLKRPVVTGATLAFRSYYRDLILPLPLNTWHDAWIALLISATSSLDALQMPLIGYRQHGANQLGVPHRDKNRSRSFASIFEPQAFRCELARERLLEFTDRFPADARKIHHLEEALIFFHARATLPRARWRRLPSALSELAALRYHRYGKGLKSFRTDLLR